MSAPFFAGSYGGDDDKLSHESRLECKICWYIYDPAVGDDYWQIPAGTSFSQLPAHWSCPHCDGKKNDFMIVGEEQ
ncbi:MAG: rubredoxin [Candidatus Thiodiazotropha sp.]|nr:rubredoxin [Candidatus Thiodiazotropha sp.]MCU7803843.1 rubredoxin [Candidatus Thiodiazotropha sp. (ex Lucinoma borealis)]MCU7945826.1 rubredoxin [Candidatus Thiodiazotropha sp. (ex Cardiolucina cf. quadrata)]MCM8881882.1 rubredoxin [Candidatus Thiodiazotropha sp.]MCM8918549.1 rubredoxin [Candidatus Thiodiazotropha sp.]